MQAIEFVVRLGFQLVSGLRATESQQTRFDDSS